MSILLLAAAAYGVWWYVNSKKGTDTNASQPPALVTKLSEYETAAQKGGTPEKIEENYSALEKASSSDQERRRVLISKADALFLNGQYEAAKKTALEAEAIESGRDTAEILAEVNVVLGNKEEARRYFEQAIAEAKKANAPEDQYQQYQKRIEGLNNE